MGYVLLTESAKVPQTVVNGRERCTMLGVDNLGQQHRRDKLGERVAKAENETTGTEHAIVDGSGVDDTTDDHQDAASNNARLTAPSVDNRWPKDIIRN